MGVHPLLVAAVEDAIEIVDFSVICGLRDYVKQQKAFDEKRSTKRPGESKHNINLAVGREYSWAVDVIPYPFMGWVNEDVRFTYVAATIIACMRRYRLVGRWGNDWDMDTIPVAKDIDEKLADLPHVEIYKILEVEKPDETYSFIPIED